MGNRSLFPAGKRSEPRPRTAPKGRPQAETHGAQRRGPPSQSPCRVLSLVLSFASKESTSPRRGGSPTTRAVVGASIPHRGKGDCACGRPKGFPRGKQSARFALPCAPLVVCLNSGSLTAFGGCIHWIPASLRSPLETFGPEGWQSFPMELQALSPRHSRRVKPSAGTFL